MAMDISIDWHRTRSALVELEEQWDNRPRAISNCLPVFAGITPSLAKLRCIEICTNDLRPEMPSAASMQEFFGG